MKKFVIKRSVNKEFFYTVKQRLLELLIMGLIKQSDDVDQIDEEETTGEIVLEKAILELLIYSFPDEFSSFPHSLKKIKKFKSN